MQQMPLKLTREILADPVFKELVSARAKLRWGFSIVTLILFFGFIALISTARGALGANVAGSTIPLDLLLALSMIGLVVVLTATEHATSCASPSIRVSTAWLCLTCAIWSRNKVAARWLIENVLFPRRGH